MENKGHTVYNPKRGFDNMVLNKQAHGDSVSIFLILWKTQYVLAFPIILTWPVNIKEI